MNVTSIRTGMPPIRIGGVDQFRPVFGGVIFHGHTEGAAEGMPGKYVGEVFWAHDPRRRRARQTPG